MQEQEADVVIILPLFQSDLRRRPPVQLMRMGSLANKVVSTKVIDGQTLDLPIEELADLTVAFRPQLVGISMLSPTYPRSLDLARAIKARRPDTLLIGGGKHATLETQGVLSTDIFDILVRGEGDLALVDIIKNVRSSRRDIPLLQKSLAGRPGITFIGDTYPLTLTPRVEINTLPPINWDILVPDLDTYLGNTASVEDQRGCVHNCSYCSASNFTRHVTFREPDQVVDEIEHLYHHGFKSFFLTGDDSFINPGHAYMMLKRIASVALPIALALNTRVDSFTQCVDRYGDDFIAVLNKANVETLHVGIESGDKQILVMCNKELYERDIHQTIAIANSLGIFVETNWIIGLPNDSEETIRNSLTLALKLRDETGHHFPHVSYFLPYPMTEETERAKAYGLYDPNNFDLSTLIAHDRPSIPTRYLSIPKVAELFSEFITTFYSDAYVGSLLTEELRNKAVQMKNKHQTQI